MGNQCSACGAVFDPLAPPPDPCPLCGCAAGTPEARIDCPSCAERVHAAADKCGYCGAWLNAARQRAEERRERAEFLRQRIQMSGDCVVCEADDILPGTRCYMCGSTDSVTPFVRGFKQPPPAAAFLILLICGILPGLVLALMMGRSITVGVPMCRPCQASWRLASLSEVLLGGLGFFGLPALGGLLGHLVGAASGTILGVLAGFVAWITAFLWLEFRYVRPRRFTCIRVDGDRVTLKFPRPDFARAAIFADE